MTITLTTSLPLRTNAGPTSKGTIHWAHDYHKDVEANLAKFTDIYENQIPKFSEAKDIELPVELYVDESHGIGNRVTVRDNDQKNY